MSTKKKKTKTRQKTKKKQNNKPSIKRELTKIFLSFVILIFIVITAAMFADYFLNKGISGNGSTKVHNKTTTYTKKNTYRKHKNRSKKTAARQKKNNKIAKNKNLPSKEGKNIGIKKRSHKKPMFEIFDDTIESVKIQRPATPLPVSKTPVIAIIIDDIGFDRNMAYHFGELDKNITFSVLPGAPFGKEIARQLHKEGIHIMLHLPMEPVEYPRINPGPDAILADMSPDQLLHQLRKDISLVPYIQGVNNHMGSRITTMPDKMRQIFTVLKEKHLFFIDSRTSKESVCKPCAKLLKIPFAQRDVFLDNIQSNAYIKKQLKELIRIAKKHGTAIAIGHPYKATLTALKEELPIMKRKVRLVPVSSLTSISG